MDVIPSIWLSSLTSAALFFSGGKLWGRVLSLHRTIEPLIRADRAARIDAEREAATVRAQAAAEIGKLTETVERQGLEAAELRARVEDLTQEVAAERARAEALVARVSAPEDTEVRAVSAQVLRRRTSSEPKLEEEIEGRLDELRRHDRSVRTAVLGDTRGLLVASSGDVDRDTILAAAASMASDTTRRLQQMLPLGEPVEIRIVDADNAVFTTRWLGGEQDGLLLSTLGASAPPKADPPAEAIREAISGLIGWT